MERLVKAGRGARAARALLVLAATGASLAAVAYAASGPHAPRRSAARAAVGTAMPSPAPVVLARRRAPRLPFVRITSRPEPVSTVTDARFAFTARGRGRRFECRLDTGAWSRCATPTSYAGLGVGGHLFSVRVAAGRRHGPSSDYRWTLLEPKRFSVEPRFGALPDLFPGAPAVTLPVTLSNPNPVPILVTSVRVVFGADPPGCDRDSNLEAIPSSASEAAPVLVPAGGTVDLPSATASAPAIALRDLPFDQDACQGAQVPLEFTGEAHG